MTIVVCDVCHREFPDRLEPHNCQVPDPVPVIGNEELKTLAIAIDASFGELGESTEDHEEARLADLAQAPLVGEELPKVPVRPAAEIALREEGLRTALLIRPVMKEMTRQLQHEVDQLRQDIGDSNRLLKHLDVPLEQVADSHERAASSFESLRAEIRAISARLHGVESVIDTAGLLEASARAEERMHGLAAAIRMQFTETARSMKQVLELLQALQDRDLDKTRTRMRRASRRAVNKVRAS